MLYHTALWSQILPSKSDPWNVFAKTRCDCSFAWTFQLDANAMKHLQLAKIPCNTIHRHLQTPATEAVVHAQFDKSTEYNTRIQVDQYRWNLTPPFGKFVHTDGTVLRHRKTDAGQYTYVSLGKAQLNNSEFSWSNIIYWTWDQQLLAIHPLITCTPTIWHLHRFNNLRLYNHWNATLIHHDITNPRMTILYNDKLYQQTFTTWTFSDSISLDPLTRSWKRHVNGNETQTKRSDGPENQP